ncbi:putative leucine-rich repeat-containing protein DDB_G0290503 [Drosophila nasuta]|uniref:putative leucine-rich repeat-containing protein DDB_G0290503 n=1 Tax=Drosophila nasuta TaxID=42062 RepID=UPI00295EB64B|nr:putative leucine-rich repeat-containing protein DDB_G0290503 [Drosophila nasuta]
MQSMTPQLLMMHLLFILSAIQGMKAYKYYAYDGGSTPHLISRRTFNAHPTVQRRTIENQCNQKGEITHWINQQVARNTKLTEFNQKVQKILDNVNENNTTEKAHCCFYENNTMDKVFADITILSEKYNINGGVALKSTGDMGQDLDRILERLKQLVGKDMKSCCNHLSAKLKELKADFVKQLEELKLKINKNPENKENLSKDKELELKNKLEKLMERMEQLEKKQLENEKISGKGTCCKELEQKLKELQSQVETAKTGNKTADLDKELQDFLDKQKEQVTKIKEIEEELKKRAANVQKILENCEKRCGNKQTGNETNGKTSKENSGINDDSRRLDTLEQMIQSLIENHKKLNNMLENMTKCKRADNCEQKRIKDQAEFQSQIEKAKVCCKDIDKLGQDNEELRQNIKKMNASYTEHLSQLNNEIKELQNGLKDALESKNPDKDTNKESSKNQEFKSELDDINKKLDQLQNTLIDNENKLNNVQQQSNLLFKELTNSLEIQKNVTKQFEKSAEKRFDDLNSKGKTENPVDQADRLDRLEKEQNKLSENINKTQELQKRVEELEKKLKEALDDLQASKSTVDKCSLKCKQLDNINDMIKRIEDLEVKVKNHKSSKNGKSNDKPKKKRKGSAIGGVDFE